MNCATGGLPARVLRRKTRAGKPPVAQIGTRAGKPPVAQIGIRQAKLTSA